MIALMAGALGAYLGLVGIVRYVTHLENEYAPGSRVEREERPR